MFANNPVNLSGAITFDLLITTPIIYFLIIRKRSIPNTTVVPVFIIGLLIASLIIPLEHQNYLVLVKTWFLPILEIIVLTYLFFTIRKAIRHFKKRTSFGFDFFTAAKDASARIFPQVLAIPVATELSVFYYGFLKWKKRKLEKNEYCYSKTTSTSLLLSVFIFLIILEAFAIHLLVQGWSTLVAWILTGLSIYACFQLLGILKSLSRRPVSLDKDQLILRYGIMSETIIPYDQIEHISSFTKSVDKSEGYAHLSPFKEMEGHNILIEVQSEWTLTGFYGFKKTFHKILLYLDEPEKFKTGIEEKLNPSL